MDGKVGLASAIIPPRGKLRSAVKRSRTYLSIEYYPTMPIRQLQGTVFAAEFPDALQHDVFASPACCAVRGDLLEQQVPPHGHPNQLLTITTILENTSYPPG